MLKTLAKEVWVEDAVSSCLFKTIRRGIYGLPGGGEGTGSQHLNLLHVMDFGPSVDDFLSGFEELLGKVTEL